MVERMKKMNVKVISVKDMDGKNVKLQEFVFMMFNHIE